MTSSRNENRIAAAFKCLRSGNQFFEFVDQELVVHVSVSNAAIADELALRVRNLRASAFLTL